MAAQTEYRPSVPAKELVPNPWNPNVLTARLTRKLKENIEREGFVDPLTVTPKARGKKLLIVDGEQRFRAAVELGIEEFPCVVLTDGGKPLPPDRARLLTLNLNHIRGEDDPVLLAGILADLGKTYPADQLASLTVFDEAQIRSLDVFLGMDESALEEAAAPYVPEDGVELAFRLTQEQASIVRAALSRAGGRTKAVQLTKVCEGYDRKK
ncbi:MAG: ParB N-terminal domain-containing protein [bacterium]